MLRAVAIAAIAVAAAVAVAPKESAAQAQSPSAVQAPGCVRPSAPSLPEHAAPGMSQAELASLHDARDAYVAAADRYRLCLDSEIVRRRDIMFRTNAPNDPVLDLHAVEHSDISHERADVMRNFVLLCMSWEDQNARTYPRGCYMREAG